MERDTQSIRLSTRSFIAKYGSKTLRLLLKKFVKGDSGQSIADRFHMSRTCVVRCKNTFGIVTTTYTPYPEDVGDSPEIAERVRERLLLRYSVDQYIRLIDGFVKGESEQSLADEFNISYIRIRRLKNTFGETVRKYTIFPEVIDELNKNDRDPDLSFA